MDTRAITLQRLQAFCAVYERGSVSGAARAMSVSQPTVSKHLRDLEAALGLDLFTLERGRVVPTAEADRLHAESRFIGEGMRRLGAAVHDLRSGAGRRLAVGCVGLLAQRHLPRALAAVTAAAPELSLEVTLRNALEQLAALREGRADIGFCAGAVAAADLWSTRIGTGTLVLVVPRDHPLAGSARVPVAALRDLADCIAMPADRPIGALVQRLRGVGGAGGAGGARGAGGAGARPGGGVTCYSLEAVLPLCAATGRPAVVDCFTAAGLGADAPLVARPLAPAQPFDLVALTRRPPDRGGIVGRLIGAMRASLADGTP